MPDIKQNLIPDLPPQLGPRVPRRGNAFSRAFANMLLKLMGWRVVGSPPNVPKFIVTAAPHTSNMDGLIFLIASVAMGLELHWIGKHTLFKGWGGRFLKWMGGISVERNSAQDLVGQVAEEFRARDALVIVIAPEGTRGLVRRWKSGYYRMAVQAEVPIALGFMDYPSKRVGFGPALDVSGEYEADMAVMMDFYRQVTPKFPARYALHEPQPPE